MANPVVIPDALFTDNGVDSAMDARLSSAAAWAKASTGVGVRAGVVYAGTSTLITATATTSPSMTVGVAPFSWVTRKAATEGAYVGANPATVIVDVAAAPGSNSRIDVVYVMQRDAFSTTAPDAVSQGEIGVITGTAAVTPTKPAIPTGALEVGTVQVSAGATKTTDATVTITTTCPWTAPLGAPVPVRNQAERDVLTQYDGLRANRLDLNYVEYSDGTNWVPTVDTYPSGQTVFVGTAPAAGTRVIRQRGSLPVTIGSGGGWGFTLPTAYANGITTVQLTVGDGSASGAVTATGGLNLIRNNCSLSALGGIAYTPAGAQLGTGSIIRLNWFTEGW